MKEIVAAKIGNIITNKKDVIITALEAGNMPEWLDRQHMQFMSTCDLGINCDKLAKGPTLFYLDNNGNLKGK